MPFNSFATDVDVVRRHNLQYRRADFVVQLPFQVGDPFRAELAITLTEVPFSSSEPSACETLIYPWLREVWKAYREHLTLWSHEPIHFDEDLCGTPDYFVARRSPLGPFVPDLPYLLVVEAK